nr:hypothetical protein [Tanacetum cinerariifolium]
EYDLMAAAADLDEIEEVNANCILMANLQQASSPELVPLEQEKPIFQHEEVPGIHRSLVEIKSPDLYLWGVHKELQEPNLVRALNLSVHASEQ